MESKFNQVPNGDEEKQAIALGGAGQAVTSSLPAQAAEMTIKQIVAHLNGVFPVDDALREGECCDLRGQGLEKT
jgi:hypothetical protein